MKDETKNLLFETILGTIITIGMIEIANLIKNDRRRKKFDNLEKSLDKSIKDLTIKEGLKEGSEEYLRKAIKLYEDFIKEAEPIQIELDRRKDFYYYLDKLIDKKRNYIT